MEIILNLVIQLRLCELEGISICMRGPRSILILLLWIAQCCVSIHILRVSQCFVWAWDSLLRLLAWLWLRRSQDLLHARSSHLIARVAYVFYAWTLCWVFAWQRIHQIDFSYLSPAELSLFHFLFIVLYTPVPVFEQRTDHDWIVTFANEVFVNYIWWRVHECGRLDGVIAWAGMGAIWRRACMVHTLGALSIQFEVLGLWSIIAIARIYSLSISHSITVSMQVSCPQSRRAVDLSLVTSTKIRRKVFVWLVDFPPEAEYQPLFQLVDMLPRLHVLLRESLLPQIHP